MLRTAFRIIVGVALLASIVSCASDGSNGGGSADPLDDPSNEIELSSCASALEISFARFFEPEWINPCVDRTGSGAFGEWIADADGRPAYEHRADPSSPDFPAMFVTGGASRDQWHFFGNDYWGATAHNDGRVEIYDLSRGPKNLNRRDRATQNVAGGFKYISMGENAWATQRDLLPQGAEYSQTFGVGYVEKTTTWRALTLRERVAAPMGDDPVLVSITEVSNGSAFPIEIEVVEFWDPNPTQLTFAPVMTYGLADIFWQQRRRINERFEMTFVDDAARGVIGAGARTLNPAPPGPDESANIDEYPRTMFLASMDDSDETVQRSLDRASFARWPDASAFENPAPEGQSLYGGDAVLAMSRVVRLDPGQSRELRYLVGYANATDIDELVERHRAPDDSPRPLTDFIVDDAPWLWREMAWHVESLLAGSYWNEYAGAHFVDQGSAYSYLQGLSGAHRDFALFTLPMVWLRPDLAKEMLRFSFLAQSAADGALPYAHIGHGLQTGAFIHTESSDLDLFLMWAAAEYLNATRDFEFLNETLPYHPKSAGGSGTVLDHLRCAFAHLRDGIGVGPHGLIRAGTGDWNDVLIAFSPWPSETRAQGESALNGALAAVALPALADAVEVADAAFADELRTFAEGQAGAVRDLWRDSWMARGYLGHGDEVLGADHLFLDAQAFGVLGGLWTRGQMAVLFSAISRHLVDPQVAGARSLWPPMTGPLLDPGSDTNGGTWSAIDGLLAWAWSTHDPDAAWDFFLSTTLTAHAEAYPEVWYGIWSGPDSFNADDHDRPGETFNSTVTPMTDFPAMNMNRHAGPLLAAIRFAGFQARGGRIVIDPKIPGGRFTWRSGFIGASYSENAVRGYLTAPTDERFTIQARVPVAVETIRLLLRGAEHSFAREGDFAVFSFDAEVGERVEWEFSAER